MTLVAPDVSAVVEVHRHRLALRLFKFNLAAVLGRAVVPNVLTFIQHGRPAPTVIVQNSGAAHLASSAFSVVTVATALISFGVLGLGQAPVRRLTVAFMGYVVFETLVALHRGPWTLSTTFVSLCALGVMLWVELEPGDAVEVAPSFIVYVGAISLVMAVFAPAAAKYGDPGASWFSRNARLAGPLNTPNEAANLFALGTVLWFARAHRAAERLGIATAASAICIVVPLVLTESYTAWCGAAVGVTIVALGPSVRNGWRPSRVGLVLLFFAVYPVSRLLLWLDAKGTATGFSGRKIVWSFIHANWRSAYLLGHGAGAWGVLTRDGVIPAWAVNGHSQWLDTLYIGGIVGIALLGGVLAAMVVRSMRLWTSGASAALACLAIELVRSYTEVPFQVIFGGQNLFVVLVLLGLMSPRTTSSGASAARDPYAAIRSALS